MSRDLQEEGAPTVADVLRDVFGHASLRPGQERALEPILAGRDTLVVMPTGTGKSLCYQLPGLLGPGLTLVISPLISLMKDQVDALRERGLAAETLNSGRSAEESDGILRDLREGRLRFLYVAPERLGNRYFLNALGPVARVAVDEAHCVSSWGHDFRPDYLRIAAFVARVGGPQIVALTATATPRVRDDVVRQLGLRDPAIVVTGFDRPNLTLDVVRARGTSQRRTKLLAALREVDASAGATIVYASSRKNAELITSWLAEADILCGLYHAGLDSGERTRVQDAFMSRETSVVVATNAFGMGIDRADVRLVVHYDLPGSLEAYYQEVGRAGRDGGPARGLLIFTPASVRLQEFFVARAHPEPTVVHAVHRHAVRAIEAGQTPTVERLEEHFDDSEERVGVGAAVNRLIGVDVLVRQGLDGRLGAGHRFRDELETLLDAAEAERRRDADLEKIATIVRYAQSRTCRRNVILDYFRAENPGAPCGRCDVCRGPGADARTLGEAEGVELLKILSAVARARGYAGRQKIVGMLVGSRAKGIAGTWLEELSTYGVMKDVGKTGVHARLDAAIDAGLVAVADGQRPVLRLTSGGVEVMKGGPAPPLAWPTRDAVATRSTTPRAATSLGEGLGPEATEVLERLRRWRTDEAARRGVPAYVVFGNRTLADLVEKRPQDADGLIGVYGLGPARIRDYGEAILEVLTND